MSSFLTPSEMAIVAVWCSLPWVVKPLWGAVSDRCSCCGYRRRPYVSLSSLMAAASLATMPQYASSASRHAFVVCLFATSMALCVCDVALDGSLMILVKWENSENEGRSQTHSWMARVAGGCLASGWSGILYQWGGLQAVCSICAAMCLALSVAALDIPDDPVSQEKTPASASLGCSTLKSSLWRFVKRSSPVLLASIMVGLIPEVGTAQFFYLLSTNATPISLSYIDLAGSTASFLSLCAYSLLKPSHRCSFFLGVLLNAVSCLFGAMLTSDSVPWIVPVACAEAVVGAAGGTLCLMPTITILGRHAAKSRYESTLYSFGLSVLNGASVVSETVSATAMRNLHIARGSTDNIRRFVGVVAALTFCLSPAALLFPGGDHSGDRKRDRKSRTDPECVPLQSDIVSEASFSLTCSESSGEDEIVFDRGSDICDEMPSPLPSV